MTVPADEVVDLVSALIRFDTSNTGDLATTKGEEECAHWVAEQARRGRLPARVHRVRRARPGQRVRPPARRRPVTRGALLIHGHLDVVPAEAADWSVHPFSGAVSDGYVWGRGAVDMKDMCGMMLAVARHFKRAGIVPPRDLVFAFVADEEHGGKYGAQWLVDNRPDLFAGVTEAVGEVGGFSITVAAPRRRRAAAVPDRDRREGTAVDAADGARPGRARLDGARRQRRHDHRRGRWHALAHMSFRWCSPTPSPSSWPRSPRRPG